MGSDKAFVEVDGMPMVARAAAVLAEAGAADVLVIGGDGDRLGELGLTAVEDRHRGEGPLGGVITALTAVESHRWSGRTAVEAVVTLPCDVIRPDVDAVRRVIEELAGPAGSVSGADLVLPLGSGAPQWTHAAWRRRCLPILSQAFAGGVRALKEAAGLLNAVEVEIGGVGWFKDADRPEDLPAAGCRGRG